MALFNNTTASAAAMTAAPQEERAGLDLHLPYRPNDMVWVIADGKAVQKRIIRITTVHRSLVSTIYKPATLIQVMLEDGSVKDGSEVFMSKDELIQSL